MFVLKSAVPSIKVDESGLPVCLLLSKAKGVDCTLTELLQLQAVFVWCSPRLHPDFVKSASPMLLFFLLLVLGYKPSIKNKRARLDFQAWLEN